MSTVPCVPDFMANATPAEREGWLRRLAEFSEVTMTDAQRRTVRTFTYLVRCAQAEATLARLRGKRVES